jgi:uncharacterized protein (TIGR02217 family)
MSFFETEFPRAIGYLAIGGPAFSTTVNEGFSGGEQRNRNWTQTRGVWTIDLQMKTQSFFDAVHAFFLAVGGQADAFRLYDHKDNTAIGQALGTGDGTTLNFQLLKNYVSGGRTYTRTITKPITDEVNDFQGNPLGDTVKVYDNGTPKALTTDYTLDQTTGLITFVTAPAAGHAITADCQFHFPVRFMVDELKAQVEPSDVLGGNILISFPQFELREVKVTL